MLALEGLGPAGIDLSKATRLKEVEVWIRNLDDVPTAMVLKTLTSNHLNLQKVSLFVCIPSPFYKTVNAGQSIEAETRRHWIELDRVLIQLWESNAIQICVQVEYPRVGRKEVVRKLMRGLLPWTMKSEAVELVDYYGGHRI